MKIAERSSVIAVQATAKMLATLARILAPAVAAYDQFYLLQRYYGSGALGAELAYDDIVITPETLPDAVQGAPYSQALHADGGTEPYTWVASGLPDGLNLERFTGVISGTPTASGASTVAVTVQEHFGAQRTVDYTLNVRSSREGLPTGYTMTFKGHYPHHSLPDVLWGGDFTITGVRGVGCTEHDAYCTYKSTDMTGTLYGWIFNLPGANPCSFPASVAVQHGSLDWSAIALGETDGVLHGALMIQAITSQQNPVNNDVCLGGVYLGTTGVVDTRPHPWPLSQPVSSGAATSSWPVHALNALSGGETVVGDVTINWIW